MESSQWIQINIETTPQQTELIEDSVLDAGAVSVTLQDAADQPILEPGVGETPLWDSCILTGTFSRFNRYLNHRTEDPDKPAIFSALILAAGGGQGLVPRMEKTF
jgi:ribosomal protein L11 methylase PrmA